MRISREKSTPAKPSLRVQTVKGIRVFRVRGVFRNFVYFCRIYEFDVGI